jgi:hypothetical protein
MEVDDVLMINTMAHQCEGGRIIFTYIFCVSTQEEETRLSVDH